MMAFDLFTAGILSVILFCFWITARAAAVPSGTLLLGMQIPKEHQSEASVRRLVASYRIAVRLLLFSALLFGIPAFLSSGFGECYLIFWALALFVSYGLLYRHFVGAMYRLKQREGWTVGKVHTVVLADTKVSARSFPSVLCWFLAVPGVFIAAALFLCCWKRDLLLFGIPEGVFPVWSLSLWQSAFYFLVLLILSCLNAGKRNRVYSEKAEENLRCNEYDKKSFFFLCLASSSTAAAGAMAGVLLGILFPGFPGYTVIFLSGLLSVALLACGMVFRRNKLRRLSSEVLCPLQTDDDYYWRKGYYSNPNDPSVLVTKRTGYGMELNMAHKITAILSAVVTAAILILVFCMVALPLIRLSGSDFALSRQEDQVEIQSPSYPSSFSLEEVEDISLIPTADLHGKRTNGLSAGGYNIGHFSSDQYGTGMWYLHKDSPQAVLIRLKDGSHIAVNQRTEEETAALYEELQDWTA